MEFNFSPLRVAVLVILFVVFAVYGGFTIPEGLPSRMMRTWSLSVLLFALSAISATVVDHWIGNLDRSNLRWFYIVLGVAGMAGAALMQHVAQEQVPTNTAVNLSQ
jgi:hypothetical protein